MHTPVRSLNHSANNSTPENNVDSAKAKENAARICQLSITSFRKEIERMDPDYLSTPETPYGAIVRDNPSPNLRKKWKRYLNSIPDTNPFDGWEDKWDKKVSY
jgi:hypothetical protein